MRRTVFLLSVILLITTVGQAQTITPQAREVQRYMVDNTVIAHRGSIYWTPELTEAAFRWARNAAADYLELDVHRSKDSVLIVMHDRTFNRTTDVAQKFPGREKDFIETFTFEEIMNLDAGSAFNRKSPDQARQSFVGLNVLVLEDAFRIAEGKRIKRNPDGSRLYHKMANGKYVFEYEQDPADNGNRPGIYIETKYPEYYPGLEEQIYEELTRCGWNPLAGEKIPKNQHFYRRGKVNIGHTKGKILLQTFSRPGMQNLKRVFKGEVLLSFLVKSPKANQPKSEEAMSEIIRFAQEVGAQFIGTNMGDAASGGNDRFLEKIHAAGLKVNIYSFNNTEQMEQFLAPAKDKNGPLMLDGMITNRADLSISFYREKEGRKVKITQTPDLILKDLGYPL